MTKGVEDEKILFCAKIFLLILEIIIVGILAFIFFGVSQVNAQTTNVPMNNYTVKWNGGSTDINNNTEYTVSLPVNEISFVFGNTEGVLVGTVWLTIDNTNIDSPNDFKIIIFNNNTRDNTGTATKNCTVSDGTSLGKKIRCQIDINITNTTQKYLQVNAKFEPSIAVLSKITANGQIVSTPAVQPATAEDIQSQTISIINNAIENSLNQSQTIIENQNQNTDRMIDHMILFHEAEEEEWEEEKGLLQSILSAIGGIFSSSIDDPTNTLNSFNNSIASNGTITSLLLLPVTIYQKVINSINATCVDITLGTLWNTTLTMPCLHIDGIIGNALYGTIDVIISGFFILAIRKRFISIFNNLSSLKTGGNELE